MGKNITLNHYLNGIRIYKPLNSNPKPKPTPTPNGNKLWGKNLLG